MKEQRQVDEPHDGQKSAGKTLKRRGILAAAGAVVAGIVAKQVSEPVLAAGVTLGGPNSTTTDTVITNTITSGAHAAIGAHCDVSVLGVGLFATGGASGVSAIGGSSAGVVGQTTNPSGTGVLGIGGSGSGGVGVAGSTGGPNSFGVVGLGRGTGVMGTGDSVGTEGDIPADSSATTQTFGVIGRNFLNRTDAYGVLGTSNHGVGVYGQTATGLYGVRGDAGTAPGSAGVLGFTNNVNGVAFGTVAVAPATIAGFFNGTTIVNGNFAVTGTKSAAVKDAAGNHRLMYCVESPDSWFEDFGVATLVNGKVDVPIDPDFGSLVHGDGYHVFVTPGDATCKGLAVTAKMNAGFTVQELNGGTSSSTFSWRVVAKRADIKGERLAKFTMPTLAMPEPGVVPPVKTPLIVPTPPQPAPAPSQARTPELIPMPSLPTSAPAGPAPIPPPRP